MIQFESLNLTVGSFSLRDVSLHVREGEYFVLLGPTGSGKTLLAECLCGLNRIDSGRIVIGGVDVTGLEPRHRKIGYVPQDYGLFPHLTVEGNVRFGLDRQHDGGADGGAVEHVAMDLVGIEHLAKRLPRKLSGGEKQRVALARALAIQPKVLVLDEPVSAVDEQTRDSLCTRLKQLQRQSGITAIHVCHSFAEMLAVADRVGIIYEGRIVQVGTPREILDQPASAMVARFVQGGNLFAAKSRVDGEWLRLTCDNGLELTAATSQTGPLTGKVTAMVRPENLRISSTRPENAAPESSVFKGTVEHVSHHGPIVKVRVAVQNKVKLLVSLGKKEYNDRPVGVGDRVYLSVAPDGVHVLQECGNLFAAKSRVDGVWLRLTCDNGLELTAATANVGPLTGEVTAMVRPENLRIGSTGPENAAPESSVFTGTVEHVLPHSSIVKVWVAVQNNVKLLVSLGKKEYNDGPIEVGDHVRLSVAPDGVHVLQEQDNGVQ